MENSELLVQAVTRWVPACSTAAALNLTAASCVAVATACREWEAGGDGSVVTDTAAVAIAAANIALKAAVADEPWDRCTEEPATRQARLAYAAWFVLLAGIDEGGTACDLDCAATLFRGAAAA